MSQPLERPRRHAVTAEEYLRMGEAGVFAPDARLELIDGEILEMAPIGSPHASTVNALNKQLVLLASDAAIVSVQNPVILGERSVPQPDLALLAPRADNYASGHPRVSDVYLVVEVADATLRFDLGTKVPLYARSGIREVWIVDVQERIVRVFRDASASGYRTSLTIGEGERLEVGAAPAIAFPLSRIFPR
jgi:Uma2 family endonuclease